MPATSRPTPSSPCRSSGDARDPRRQGDLDGEGIEDVKRARAEALPAGGTSLRGLAEETGIAGSEVRPG
jgi:hypothetical protein